MDILYKEKPHNIVISDETQGEGMAYADELYIRNVMRNLVENALKYSDDGVNVQVLIRNIDEGIEVSVTDDGWGIAPQGPEVDFQTVLPCTAA